MSTKRSYAPDYAVHPGEILEETLEARGISKTEFAQRCGIAAKTVSLIVSGHAPVSPEMSIQFERVLGVSSALWNNLNATWQLFAAKQAAAHELAEALGWAKLFPVKEMVKRRWLPVAKENVDIVDGLLSFFGVASPEAWQTGFNDLQVAYRKSPSFKSSPHAVAAWLRRGEILADSVETAPYSAADFSEALQEIQSLTVKPPAQFEPRMKTLCRESGVALVIEGELPGTCLSGAARWLTKDKALIQLSLRHKTNDHFWFSFFHEAAHVLKHGKRKLYLDDAKSGNTGLEDEANRIAAELLISQREYSVLCEQARTLDATTIRDFARKQGIAPGIVLGRLQHDEKIPFMTYLNKQLKQSFTLKDD